MRTRHRTRTSPREDRQDRKPTTLAPVAVGPRSASGLDGPTGAGHWSALRLPGAGGVAPPTRCRRNRSEQSVSGPHHGIPRRPCDCGPRTGETRERLRESAEDTGRTPETDDRPHCPHHRHTRTPHLPGPATAEPKSGATPRAAEAPRRKRPPRTSASKRVGTRDEKPLHRQTVPDRPDTRTPGTPRGTRN